MDVTKVEFATYRSSSNFYSFTHKTPPQPIQQKHGPTPAELFRKAIKPDASAYPSLSDDKQWDRYHRELVATCRAQGLSNVLDPSHNPHPNSDAFALFQEHKGFMYSVFIKTLKTDFAKSLVRRYQLTFDAQRIYEDLVEYYKTSVKADTTAAVILEYLTSVKLTADSWPNTHESFILHWLDQLRLYHELAPDQTMPEQQQRRMLLATFLT